MYAYAEQKTKTAAELAGQLKSETKEKERWQSIARQEADRADEKDQRLQELQSRIHSEVEASKRRCGASLQNLRKNSVRIFGRK